jgi:putative MATE family efflux protein
VNSNRKEVIALTALLRRFFSTKSMLSDSQRLGEVPGTYEAYRTALNIALPSMSEALLVALVSLVDTIMVSSIGTEAIAAVALCTQPRFIIITPILALNVAITSIVARRKGEGNTTSAGHCLRQGILISLAVSLVASALAMVFRREILWFVGAQADTIEQATWYLQYILLGIPPFCVSATICAAQRGAGNTRVAMRVNVVANLVNIVFNYLLIGGNFGFPRLETKGAAIATSLGWTVGLFLALFSVSYRESFLTIRSKEGWRFEKETLQPIYQVASGAFVEQAFVRIGILTYSKLVAGLGTVMLAANTIGMNIISMSFSIGDGLGICAASLVGQNLGKKRPDLAEMYGKVCSRIAAVLCSIIFLFFVLRGRWIFSLFSTEPAIVQVSEAIMVIISITTMGQAIQLVYMGSLRGAGDTRYTAAVSMLCLMILRPGLAWVLAYPAKMGLIGAWLGFLADQYLRLLLTYLRFKGGRWMKIKL